MFAAKSARNDASGFRRRLRDAQRSRLPPPRPRLLGVSTAERSSPLHPFVFYFVFSARHSRERSPVNESIFVVACRQRQSTVAAPSRLRMQLCITMSSGRGFRCCTVACGWIAGGGGVEAGFGFGVQPAKVRSNVARVSLRVIIASCLLQVVYWNSSWGDRPCERCRFFASCELVRLHVSELPMCSPLNSMWTVGAYEFSTSHKLYSEPTAGITVNARFRHHRPSPAFSSSRL